MKRNNNILTYSLAICVGLAMIGIGFSISSFISGGVPKNLAPQGNSEITTKQPAQPQESTSSDTKLRIAQTQQQPTQIHNPERAADGKRAFKLERIVSDQDELADDELGLTVSEIKAMHAEQARELVLAQNDQVIEGTNLTVDQLKAMHEKQRQAPDPNEIIIEPTKENPKGVTLGELKALHEKQRSLEVNQPAAMNEVIIKSTDPNVPDLTVADIKAMHERQKLTKGDVVADDDDVAISSEDDSDRMSVSELKALHKRQIK